MGGEKDIHNRYRGTVSVSARLPEEVTNCSGAVISRTLILTAGHCVCPRLKAAPPEEGAAVMIDASECAGRASVGTIVYKARGGDEDAVGFSTQVYGGVIRPHPELKVLLDGQGGVISSRADLAVIVLDRPLQEQEGRSIPLADEAVQPGELLVIVGHGYDEVANVYDRERRFSRNQVSRILEAQEGRVLIRQPEGHLYRGDSGGPCLRELRQGPVLVGISSRWLGQGGSFTSTHGYRKWLSAELERADRLALPQ
ncbi:trypsin-like serine peptidase [Hyalangium sp.]|uniref:trypsin-like serine peptidase n=1 Tax=Hyalangium sp. TaxID=2028555 RepID=UPI002D49925A|nr:trypsin-like peptidase domain-containing protein [Hyalangium sp.]HYH97155.1 trypsin-like peptidase domain-containing protein [Hyalangium sp.]